MTRVSAGTRRCPNCGRDITSPVAGADEAETPSLPPVPVPRAEGKRKAPVKERAPETPEAPRAPSPKPVSFTLDPAQVRVLVAATPALIEPGLRVYQDGGSVPTAVGEIDLLAVDDAGGLVVVMVAEGEPGKEVVLELLERIGFVRTQVAENGQEVRGLLLAERLPEPTRYTIAAVGDTVSVKSWRVALSFDDLAV
jgi:hypothetical protein